MLKITYSWLWVVALALSSLNAQAEPAQKVLGRDYVFPNKIAGLPAKLSDFKDLEINALYSFLAGLPMERNSST